MIPEFTISVEQAEDLQHYVEEHMDRCHQVIDFEGEEVPEELADVEMYCGCHVCEVREHLVSTFTWLRKNGILDLYVE